MIGLCEQNTEGFVIFCESGTKAVLPRDALNINPANSTEAEMRNMAEDVLCIEHMARSISSNGKGCDSSMLQFEIGPQNELAPTAEISALEEMETICMEVRQYTSKCTEMHACLHIYRTFVELSSY